jgi:drug/metabolite transporter (DMT)-like permease
VIPRTDLTLLAVALVWGSSYLAAQQVVTADSVFAMLVLRFGVAAVGLAVVLAPRLSRLTRDEVLLGMAFGVILSVVLALETFGLTRTSASNAGLIISLTMVLTPVMSPRRLPGAFYPAAGTAVVGVAVLGGGGFAGLGAGDVLMVLAAVARAVHLTVIDQMSRRRTVDSARTTLVQLLTALAVFVVSAPVTGRGVVDVAGTLDARGWVLTLYLALGCTVFAFLVQMWAVRRTSSSRVSLLLGTEPLWAAMLGVLIGGDPMTVAGVIGAAMILGGVNWARSTESRLYTCADGRRDDGDPAVAVPGEVDGRSPGTGVAHGPARRPRRSAVGGARPGERHHCLGATGSGAAGLHRQVLLRARSRRRTRKCARCRHHLARR